MKIKEINKMVQSPQRLACLILSAIFFQFILSASIQFTFGEQVSQNYSQLTLLKSNESLRSLDWVDEAGAHVPQAQDNLILGADKWQKNSTFHMVVIGDSVAWGAGLEQKEKYYYKVADWLQNKLMRSIEVTQSIFHLRDPMVQMNPGCGS